MSHRIAEDLEDQPLAAFGFHGQFCIKSLVWTNQTEADFQQPWQ